MVCSNHVVYADRGLLFYIQGLRDIPYFHLLDPAVFTVFEFNVACVGDVAQDCTDQCGFASPIPADDGIQGAAVYVEADIV